MCTKGTVGDRDKECEFGVVLFHSMAENYQNSGLRTQGSSLLPLPSSLDYTHYFHFRGGLNPIDRIYTLR